MCDSSITRQPPKHDMFRVSSERRIDSGQSVPKMFQNRTLSKKKLKAASIFLALFVVFWRQFVSKEQKNSYPLTEKKFSNDFYSEKFQSHKSNPQNISFKIALCIFVLLTETPVERKINKPEERSVALLRFVSHICGL